MMRPSLLAGIAVTGVVAGFVAGVFSPRLPGAAPPAAAARAAAPAPTAPAGEPLPPLVLPERARSQVPAGILARAAEARALDRGPSCSAPDREHAPPRCASEPRETIEIEWHVAAER
jgi:hypothetical protein